MASLQPVQRLHALIRGRHSVPQCVPGGQRTAQPAWQPGDEHAEQPSRTAPVHDPLADFEHPVSVEEFRRMGYEAVDMVCEYVQHVLPSTRVMPDVQPGYLRPLLPPAAPTQPEPWAAVKQDFWDVILKGVTHWQSPNNFAWFPGSTSLPGILAEMLMGALNIIGFSWESGPVSTELEMVVMDWLVQLCGLPDKFLCAPLGACSCQGSEHIPVASSGSVSGCSQHCSSDTSSECAAAGSHGGSSSSCDNIGSSSSRRGGGVIQGTSSEAVLVAMLAARARALAGQPAEAALKLVAYGTQQAHSCFKKATMIVGLQHVRLLPATADTQFAVQPQQLAEAVTADLQQGLIPFYFMATIGTTSSCAVDPISELADVCLRHSIWMHVDAAWAGTAAILPEQCHWFKGLDKVDSYSFNPYKWMLTPMNVCACWFEDSTYVKQALSLTPVYLRNTQEVFDYKDWEIILGRRFRSLSLWFVLRMYGSEKLQAMVRHHIALGQWLAQQVQQDNRFELAAPPRFGLTCLRLKGVGNKGNKQLLDAVNAAGLSHMVGTELDGLFTLRVAVGQAYTQLQHVQQVWHNITEQADIVLSKQAQAQAQAETETEMVPACAALGD